MLSPRFDWMLQCCSGASDREPPIELQLQLGGTPEAIPRHLITSADPMDVTFVSSVLGSDASGPNGRPSPRCPITPRQRDLRDQLELPLLHTYPAPPDCQPDEPEDQKREKLLQMYQDFTLEMHSGVYLTQLTANRDYSEIHCQLMEDMQTLKLDQSNGRIIEFPLTGVSKVYRIVKNNDKWYSAGSAVPNGQSENLVVVEFMRRKLAFVFKELQVSQRFLVCMELLIRRAHQKQAKKALRSLTPAFPIPGDSSRGT